MGQQFFTWGNFITWVFCSIFIYLALNFRIYMIFHHPGRKLKAKTRGGRTRMVHRRDYGSAPQPGDPDCLQGAHCFVRTNGIADESLRKR